MGVKIFPRNGIWQLRINHEGLRKTVSLHTTDRKDALLAKKKMETEFAMKAVGIKPDMKEQTFGEYAAKWLVNHVKVTETTAKSYEAHIRVHLLPMLGGKYLNEITREDAKALQVKQMRATVTDKSGVEKLKYSRETIQRVMVVLNMILDEAVEDNLIPSNPARGISKFNTQEKSKARGQAMKREHIQRFLATAKDMYPEYWLAFATDFKTGLRHGELVALRWEDIQIGIDADDQDNCILVQRTWDRHARKIQKCKSGLDRRVDMSRELRSILLAYRDLAAEKAFKMGKISIAEDLMFPSERGGILANHALATAMGNIIEAAALPRFRFHDIRHTFGSLLIQAGVSPAYVQKQMGHSSIQITIDIYGHLIPGGNRDWIDNIDRHMPAQQPATDMQHGEN